VLDEETMKPDDCQLGDRKERKGKEEYLYSAIYTAHSLKALRHA